MSLAEAVARLVYPPRRAAADATEDEIEEWVDAAGLDYFSGLEEDFVERALNLGVSSGMVLDLNSRLGLVPLKMLWKQEDFIAMGVYRSRAMADRTRDIAEDWGMDQRMFLQVGEPARFQFKTGYFDLVVSDSALNQWTDPQAVLGEIQRITKPSGAVLIRDLIRPSRLRMSGHIRKHAGRYPAPLRSAYKRQVRGGFTPAEFLAFAEIFGEDRTRVLADRTHVMLERRGTDDPTSWVIEREKYR